MSHSGCLEGPSTGNLVHLPPRQFPFASRWSRDIRPLLETAPPGQELVRLFMKYLEMMKSMLEDGALGEGKTGRNYFRTKIQDAQAHALDLEWLRDVWEADDLLDLSLAIARELMPHEQWEIVENGEHAVVANRLRTLVLDMKLFDKLSASESLVYAGDPDFIGKVRDLSGLYAYLEERQAVMDAALESARSLLDSLNESEETHF